MGDLAVNINVSGSNTFQLNKCFTFPEKVLLGDTPMYVLHRRRKSTSHSLNSMLTDIQDAIWPQWCLSSICWVSLTNSKLYNTNMCFLFVLGDGGRDPKCRVQSMATMWGNDLINPFPTITTHMCITGCQIMPDILWQYNHSFICYDDISFISQWPCYDMRNRKKVQYNLYD